MTVSETDVTRYDPTLSISFETIAGRRQLFSIRLGSYQYRY
ncbi:MAG TPA: hypothetical protein VMB49_11135 [Acidobacteriaceae bacterium]|nr:hypothetical protein [Acidobacteriaceae bacterium]